ncbi:MAG: ABC transporter ATP-binding protein, partial [Planctomycetota bacterium]
PAGEEPVRVLEAVSLEVRAGDSISVAGPSGSGKSTLLNIMGALDRPSSGTVRVAGSELGGMSDEQLAALRSREIGFVFQMHHLLPQCTVVENVLVPTIPLGESAAEGAAGRAAELLERAGLAARAQHRPGQLSGGECQRVAVVRALINRPRLLLADEPTGSLDRTASESLVEMLTDLHGGGETALVVVTHSERVAEGMSRRFRLADGRLEER